MKKVYNIIIYVFVVATLTSCFKDLGNYDYTDKEVISITGIQESYTAIQLVDKLNLTPTVTSNKPAEFEYYYALYETNVQGYAPVMDTIQRTGKDLVNYLVTKKAMTYGLVFMAKNKKTGVTGFFKSTLNVVTKFNNGWYVLKNEGEVCDLDLFDATNNKIENVLLAINGKQLKGSASCLTVASNYKAYDVSTGRFVNTTTLFPVTDKDAMAVILSTAKVEHGFGDMFYEEISGPFAPTMFMATFQGLWTTNHGRAFGIYGMSANSGKFGMEFPIDINYTPYYLSKYSAFHGSNGPLSFDETSSTFVIVPPFGTTLIPAKNQTVTEMSAFNNNKTILYMGSRSLYDTYFFAVMKDKTNPNVKFISKVEGFNSSSSISLKITNDTLATSDLAFNASMYTSNHSLDIMYFVSGGKIYMRNVAAKRTTNVDLGISIPAGETVSFIKHIPKTSATTFNYFVVGTTISGNYKVRMYNVKSTGDVETTPALILEGKGRAGDVLFTFPTISHSTFPASF